jgi:hypothetical protein
MVLSILQDYVSNGATESVGTIDGWRYQIHRVVLMDGTTKNVEIHRIGTMKYVDLIWRRNYEI